MNTRFSSLPDSTSYFKRHHVANLNIEFIHDESYVETNYEIPPSLMLKNYDEKDIIFIENLQNNTVLNTEEKTLIELLQRVILNEKVALGTRESLTDTFVDFILRAFSFDKYPLRLNMRPLYTFQVGQKKITSECDFSIENGKNILIVEDDKHLTNTFKSDEFGEFQIAGEFLAAASTNYQDNPCDQLIYGVRVIGTRFTFYKARFPKEYLYSLNEIIPDIKSIIYRNGKGYNFTSWEDRKYILNMLSYLKQTF
jgi:hypothetical protein